MPLRLRATVCISLPCALVRVRKGGLKRAADCSAAHSNTLRPKCYALKKQQGNRVTDREAREGCTVMVLLRADRGWR